MIQKSRVTAIPHEVRQENYTTALRSHFESVFTGVAIVGVPGDWSAEYKGHLVSDPDIFRLMNKVWEANA